jgi:hypothetical protein
MYVLFNIYIVTQETGTKEPELNGTTIPKI